MEIKGGKIRVIVLAVAVVIVCIASAAYFNIGRSNAGEGSGRVAVENASEQATVPTQAADSKSNILVVYFTAAENSDVDAVNSASVTVVDGVAKGNVRAIADEIAAQTGGDLFSIQTSVEYPGGINALINYAQDEQNNNVRPELTSHIANLDQYDTVFIGYPTWWYDLPQIMYSFFDEYDFSGKTIVPFNSANGSQFSGTIGTIQKLEPAATVVTDGLSVHQNNTAKASTEVSSWLAKIGY